MIVPVNFTRKKVTCPNPAELFSLPTSVPTGPPNRVIRSDSSPGCVDVNALYDVARSLGFVTEIADYKVYVIKCKKIKHWYIGMTLYAKERFLRHESGVGAWFVRDYGLDSVWSIFEVSGKYRAKFLETQCYEIFRREYPDFCFSIGNPCKCTNYCFTKY